MTSEPTMHEEDLAAAFAAITPPPMRLTSADAIQLGRRSQRRHRYAVTGVAAGGLAVAVLGAVAWAGPLTSHRSTLTTAPSTAATAASGPTCVATKLASAPGISAYEYGVVGIDPTGHYVVGNGDSAIVYHDGHPTVIPLPHGVAAGNMQATAVNASGVVIGVASTGINDNQHGWAWKWQDGTLTQLPTPSIAGALKAIPTGINSTGDIVGIVQTQAAGPGGNSDEYAVEWPATTPGTVTTFAVPSGEDGSEAYAITDSGYVVGGVGFANGTPFYWDPTGLGHLLAATPGRPHGVAIDIVGDTIYGYADGAGVTSTAAQWSLTSGKLTLDAGHQQAVNANTSGDIVMRAPTAVLIGGRAARLALPKGVTGTVEVAGIANDRTVAGFIETATGIDFVIWHC